MLRVLCMDGRLGCAAGRMPSPRPTADTSARNAVSSQARWRRRMHTISARTSASPPRRICILRRDRGFFTARLKKPSVAITQRNSTQGNDPYETKQNRRESRGNLQSGRQRINAPRTNGQTGEPSKKVFKSLKKLFEHELIETQGRKYKLTGKSPKASAEEETEDLPE